MVLLTRLRVLVPKRSLIAAVRLLKLVCGLPGTLLENAIVGVYVDGASIQWTSVSYIVILYHPQRILMKQSRRLMDNIYFHAFKSRR
jgi:hypothetical protein